MLCPTLNRRFGPLSDLGTSHLRRPLYASEADVVSLPAKGRKAPPAEVSLTASSHLDRRSLCAAIPWQCWHANGIGPIAQQGLHDEHDGPCERKFPASVGEVESFANGPELRRPDHQRKRIKAGVSGVDAEEKQNGTNKLGTKSIV